jgi:hypothetical protein
VLSDLKERFESLIRFLEDFADRKTRRVRPPVMILGHFQGVETGIRQLMRSQPLETKKVNVEGNEIMVPRPEEMLPAKGWLVLTRNALRDYIDTAALSHFLGRERSSEALKKFDHYSRDIYQKGVVSPLLQLARQLSDPSPYDLDDIDVKNYKGITNPGIPGKISRLSAGRSLSG